MSESKAVEMLVRLKADYPCVICDAPLGESAPFVYDRDSDGYAHRHCYNEREARLSACGDGAACPFPDMLGRAIAATVAVIICLLGAAPSLQAESEVMFTLAPDVWTFTDPSDEITGDEYWNIETHFYDGPGAAVVMHLTEASNGGRAVVSNQNGHITGLILHTSDSEQTITALVTVRAVGYADNINGAAGIGDVAVYHPVWPFDGYFAQDFYSGQFSTSQPNGSAGALLTVDRTIERIVTFRTGEPYFVRMSSTATTNQPFQGGMSGMRVDIEINASAVIHADGFESGDVSGWSYVTEE